MKRGETFVWIVTKHQTKFQILCKQIASAMLNEHTGQTFFKKARISEFKVFWYFMFLNSLPNFI